MLKIRLKTTKYVEKPVKNRQKFAKTGKKTPKLSKNRQKSRKTVKNCQ